MNELPTTAEAEKWLTPDTFVVKGKIYSLEQCQNCGFIYVEYNGELDKSKEV